MKGGQGNAKNRVGKTASQLVEEANLTVNEKILRQCHALYMDKEKGKFHLLGSWLEGVARGEKIQGGTSERNNCRLRIELPPAVCIR